MMMSAAPPSDPATRLATAAQTVETLREQLPDLDHATITAVRDLLLPILLGPTTAHAHARETPPADLVRIDMIAPPPTA